MGTSSIFNGRSDKNKLIPDDYEPSPQEEQNLEKQIQWKTVKSDMSKYAKSGGVYSSVKHITKQYVKASGGTKRMLSQSSTGIKVGGNIGGFFNSIIENGFEHTFKSLGIKYTGKSVTEIFSQLINIIAPNSDTKEDVVAKEAAREALSKVYDYVESNELDINSIDRMPTELMNEVLKEYIGSYIWISMMKDLGSRLEMYIEDAHNSFMIEQEFKDMIVGIVDIEFKNKDRIVDQNVLSTLNELYERTLYVLEGIV